ncbi:MAG TPA: phosphoribosylformylglycinamidine synthase subunit PurQ [Phycisphaerales bacterium]|nr:phosphoribosylformylglycinamidine synthase subunit PurQ [Phycisphaerales bacterium]HMP38687.1 phosphoribosylformylglycinamidine synthase subunit PurQ [Phycisphaerales bacterium]
MPSALVITAPGINCDLELAEAFALVGCEVERILLGRLTRQPELVDRFELIGLPGGFSYGDDIAAGRIMAQLIRAGIARRLVDALARGVPIIAPCNGFQIAVQAGLLPDPAPSPGASGPEESPALPRPSVALCDNDSGRFCDRWVRVEVPVKTHCIWTRGLRPVGAGSMLPIAHGEGRFTTDAATLRTLERDGRVALRYASDDNPNGSIGAIAGICDPTGRCFGLMPHPERFTRWTQHPWWTRLGDDERSGTPLGLAMFESAVRSLAAAAPAGGR